MFKRGSLPLQTDVKRPIRLLLLPENFMSVLDSVLFGHCTLGVGAGIWKHTKGLLNHHITAVTERDFTVPLSKIVFFFFYMTTSSAIIKAAADVLSLF